MRYRSRFVVAELVKAEEVDSNRAIQRRFSGDSGGREEG